jgi:hypothetical protein
MEFEISQFLIPDNIRDILALSLILYVSFRFFSFWLSRRAHVPSFHGEVMRMPFGVPYI